MGFSLPLSLPLPSLCSLCLSQINKCTNFRYSQYTDKSQIHNSWLGLSPKLLTLYSLPTQHRDQTLPVLQNIPQIQRLPTTSTVYWSQPPPFSSWVLQQLPNKWSCFSPFCSQCSRATLQTPKSGRGIPLLKTLFWPPLPIISSFSTLRSQAPPYPTSHCSSVIRHPLASGPGCSSSTYLHGLLPSLVSLFIYYYF